MSYFLTIENQALAPELLALLRKAISEEELVQGGHACFAKFLRTLPNLAPWCNEKLHPASFSVSMTLLALLAKDLVVVEEDEALRHAFLMDLAAILNREDSVNLQDAMYSTGIAFVYHNIALNTHTDKLMVMPEFYLSLANVDHMVDFDGSDRENFFGADIFPFLAKLMRASSLKVDPYMGFNCSKWMSDEIKQCADFELLFESKSFKKACLAALFEHVRKIDELAGDAGDDDCFEPKLTAHIIQYASEMGRLALLQRDYPDELILQGVRELAEAMCEHYQLAEPETHMLSRMAMVHAGIIWPDSLKELNPPLCPADLQGPEGEWSFPAPLDKIFMTANLRLGILSSYESSVGSIDWIPIYDRLFMLAGMTAEEFIDARGDQGPCQNLYLNDLKNPDFMRFLRLFLQSTALEETKGNGVYFLSRRLRYVPLEESDLRRLQKLELKTLSTPRSINQYLIQFYRTTRGLSRNEALTYLDSIDGLNSLDALKAVEAEFSDLKPFHQKLSAATKRHFLSNDLEI
jgi:hypothetical protein